MPTVSRRNVLVVGGASLLSAATGAAGVGAWTQQTPPLLPPAPAPSLWTDEERKAIVAYWNAPGRYTINGKPSNKVWLSEVSADDDWRVNITTEGSKWYQKFANSLNDLRKIKPAQADEWSLWFEKRLNTDRSDANKGPNGNLIVDYPRADPQPPSLSEALGEAPIFYEEVRPNKYTVTFAPEDAPAPFVYLDNLNFTGPKPYYAYYRSTNGVRKFGKRLASMSTQEKADAAALFAGVASSPFEQHVLGAVSRLEGGFDAVNTYDTGWISIGFIQFITKRDGTGSLASVLARHKQNDAQDFAKTFHRFGIDVDANGVFAVCDPVTGNERHGTDAVSAAINDKRLTAVWERAGSLPGFRKAQVAIARQQYWPGDDLITAAVGPEGSPPQTVKVSDVVKSEAGMATLMDRKVNRGNLGNLSEIATQIMRDNKLTNIADLVRYEKPLIEGMKYRANYLTDPNLTQPAALPPSPPAP